MGLFEETCLYGDMKLKEIRLLSLAAGILIMRWKHCRVYRVRIRSCV